VIVGAYRSLLRSVVGLRGVLAPGRGSACEGPWRVLLGPGLCGSPPHPHGPSYPELPVNPTTPDQGVPLAMRTLVRRCLSAFVTKPHAARELPLLLPGLAYSTLAPYLGTEAAREESRPTTPSTPEAIRHEAGRGE
jgi:hypothetical protein